MVGGGSLSPDIKDNPVAFQPDMDYYFRVIDKIKTVGRRTDLIPDPVAAHRKALILTRQADKLNPYPKPRGFVYKGRTRDEYDLWKAAQKNPRLW